MEKFHMNRLYLDGFPLVVQELYQWDRMLEKLDKKLFLHLKKQGVISSMYASKWFLTIFASTFSFSIVIRIWDNYIYDGIIFVFQTAFAILKLFRKSLLKMDFEKLLGFLQNIQLQEIKEEELISTALSVNISHKDLAIWADEHAKQLQKQEKEKEKEKEEKQEKEKN
ncbi:rab-gtpase-tbc domain-containing protein-related [Anaeramoeba ignava]|uniref:Rab-gtpase-tbc domain-containing protein-related n=1 Tax=Anaeramoeba ignava TaxID=1746090 RepID=A0A9Q0LT81_ANAIG|nr:rab-gtpase-tbc domain-containing protein-related [Anaeramoeba ignava]